MNKKSIAAFVIGGALTFCSLPLFASYQTMTLPQVAKMTVENRTMILQDRASINNLRAMIAEDRANISKLRAMIMEDHANINRLRAMIMEDRANINRLRAIIMENRATLQRLMHSTQH